MGKATYVPEDFWPLNTSLYVKDFRGNDPRFLYYMLTQIDFSGFNSGGVHPMLNRNYIKQIPLRVPVPTGQKAIAAVLGALDDKIAVNERICATYERILRLRFEDLGVDSEPMPGREITVSDLIDLNPLTVAPDTDEAVYLEMAVLPTQSARVRSWSRRRPKSGTRFINGDTVMARITPCLENGKVAFVDFMEDGEVGVGSTEFIVFRVRPGVPVQLAYFLARSPRFQNHAVQNMSGSSGRQRVGVAALAPFPVNLPETEALERFGEVAAVTFAHMKSLDAESTHLGDLRDTLLPALMSGEIRVRDAERVVEEAT